MRPIELVLEGFRSYDRRTTFDWRGRQLVGIVGPIGSGKSSILDAVTFALYGKTPVFERENKTLIREGRDSARVELAFGVEDQVWRVLRVIKRRGAGQHALYRVSDLGPSLECDREKEVTARVEALLGLDFQAFCRSVLLAQNRFAEFLHASAGDQDKVLKGVFGFDRLDEMHRLAKDRRLETELACRELRGQLHHVEEDRQRLAAAKRELRRAEAQSRRLEAAATEVEELEKSAAEAGRGVRNAEDRLRELERIAEQLPPAEELSRQLERLDGAAAGQEAADRRWRRARQQVERAEEELQAIRAESGGGEELAAAEHRLDELERARQQLERLQQSRAEAAAEVEVKRAAMERAAREVERAEETRAAALAAAEGARAECDEVRRELAAAEAASGGRIVLEQARQRLERLLAARQECLRRQRDTAEHAARLQASEDALELVRLGFQAARAAERSTRQQVDRDRDRAARAEEAFKYAQRENMALALADQLEPGQPCPVCDQVVEVMPAFRLSPALEEAEAHRQRAREELARSEQLLLETSSTAAGRRQALQNAEERLQEARRDHTQARQLSEEGERACGELEAELEKLLASAPAATGRDATSAERELDFETRITLAGERLGRLEPRLLELEAAQRQAESALKDAVHAVEIASQQRRAAGEASSAAGDRLAQLETAWRETSESVADGLRELADRFGDDDPRARLKEERQRLIAAERRLEAARHEEKSQARVAEQTRQKNEAMRGEQEHLMRQLSGLAGQLGLELDGEASSSREFAERLRQRWQGARSQAEGERDLARKRIEEAAAERATLWRRLELEPGVGFERALATAQSARDAAATTVEELETRLAAATDLQARLEGREQKLRLYRQLSDDLTASRFLRYLLNEERAALAALGSERFEMLSGGRYRFSEDGTFAIVDLANADAVRRSETLSGGESFLASLALALALAEKVTGGGGRLDAFFLDEGFGSLDPEHFDLAMEGIERLVTDSPERLVTVVSHVPEMRQRIDDLIVLDKDPRDGSTIVRQGAGGEETWTAEA